MEKDIYDKLRKIEAESNNINVTKYKSKKAFEDRIIREFNKGKSFEFSEWKPLITYFNDDFKQDFVVYNNSLLACKYTHVSKKEPDLEYNLNSGLPIGVKSSEWIFVFATGIDLSNYYTKEDTLNIINDYHTVLSESEYQNLSEKEDKLYFVYEED